MHRLFKYSASLVVLLTVACVSALSQNIDSLEIVLGNTDDPVERIHLYNLLTEEYLVNDIDKAHEYAERSLQMSRDYDLMKEEAIARYFLGRILNSKNDLDSARRLLSSAYDYFSTHKDHRFTGLAAMNLGYTLKQLHKLDAALGRFHEARLIFTDINDQKSLASALNHIGGIYYDRSELDEAANYFIKSLSIRQKINDRSGLAGSFNNVGEIYRMKGNYEKALEYYYQAVRINRETGNEYFLAINYDNIGNIFLETGNHENAFNYLQRSLDIALSLDIPRLHSTILNSYARYHLETGQTRKARKLFEQAYDKAISSHDIYSVRDALVGLSEVHAAAGNYRKAFLANSEFIHLNDSLLNIKTGVDITRYEMQLEFEDQQRMKQLENRRRGLIWFIAGAALFSLLVIVILLYGRQRILTRYGSLEKEQIQLEGRLLEEEIRHKNRELTTSLMYVLRKNELVASVSEKLLKAKRKFRKDNQGEIEQVIIRLNELTDQGVWKRFEEKFNEVHTDFFSTLDSKFRNLTDKDKMLCALLRLNLTTKEIAAIIQQSLNSVQVARTRLRKKLKIDNTDINLIKFLSEL